MSLPVYIVITPFFPSPDNWRGAYCYDFVKALMRTEKYDVRVFVPGKGDDYEYHGVRVCRFLDRMLPSAVFPFLFSCSNQKAFLRKIRQENIPFSQIKVCHAHTAFFGIYALAVKKQNPKCKTLLHHHDPASFGLNLGKLRHFYPHKLINFVLLKKMHEQIDCHVFISKMVKNSFSSVPDAAWSCYSEYQRQMKGLQFTCQTHIRNSLILHNGVDSSIFSPASANKTDHGFRIGCIGNFGDWKSQITLLQAIKSLKQFFPDLSVRFVGSGEYLDQCRNFVKENLLESIVSFESECDHHDLPSFYYSIDLFVLPSYFEGFGCVFTEAYSCGVPFITCEGQGMDDLIPQEERGLWLCPPMNPDILAEKIRYYFIHRPIMHLSGPVDINILVSNFIKELEEILT